MPYRQKTNIQLFQIATVLFSSALRAVLSHLRRNKIRIEYVQSFQQTSGFIPRADKHQASFRMSVFSILYRGLSFTSIYIFPIYSPTIPNAAKIKPPTNQIEIISEAQPGTVS